MKLLYGSQNFGYDLPTSDKDWMEFVYPTWDDLINNNMKAEEVKNEDGSFTKIKDIRFIPRMILKSNLQDLQILYSQEMQNCYDLNWFLINRDRLIRCNLWQMFNTNKGFVLSCLKKGDLKNQIRVWAITNLIFDLTTDKEIVFCDKTFREVRKEDNKEAFLSASEIEQCLNNLEPFFSQYRDRRDEEIIQEMHREVKRLLYINLM